MRIRKTNALLMALVMILALFAACGKKADTTAESKTEKPAGTASNPSSGTSSGTAAAAPSGGVVTQTTEQITEADKVHPSDDAKLRVAWNIDCTGLMQVGYADCYFWHAIP